MPRRNNGAKLEWRKDRNIYEIIHYQAGRRKRHSTGTPSLEEAENYFQKWLGIHAERKRGYDAPKRPDERLISTSIADYIEEKTPDMKLSTQQAHYYNAQNLMGFWGELSAADINEGTCRLYREHRQSAWDKKALKRGRAVKPLSDSTIARELSLLQSSLHHDYKRGRLSRQVFVPKPTPAPPRERWLTKQEAAKLLEAADSMHHSEYLGLFIRIGLYGGARKEVIMGLRWAQVDFERETINFNPIGQKQGGTKQHAVVPIFQPLMPHLLEARERGTDLGYVIHRNQEPMQSLKKSFQKACRIAGLQDVMQHTLRHTFGSWLVQAGIDLFIVAKLMGHKDTKMVQRHYGHLAISHLRVGESAFMDVTAPVTAPTLKAIGEKLCLST